MAAFIIDASLASSWCFPDERTIYTEAALDALSNGAEALAPRLWAYEVRNSVLIGMRRKRITMPHAEAFLDDLNAFRIRLVDPPSYSDVFKLADRHRLTVYDAAYLELAIREGIPLASLDQELIRSAKDLGLSVFDTGR